MSEPEYIDIDDEEEVDHGEEYSSEEKSDAELKYGQGKIEEMLKKAPTKSSLKKPALAEEDDSAEESDEGAPYGQEKIAEMLKKAPPKSIIKKAGRKRMLRSPPLPRSSEEREPEQNIAERADAEFIITTKHGEQANYTAIYNIPDSKRREYEHRKSELKEYFPHRNSNHEDARRRFDMIEKDGERLRILQWENSVSATSNTGFDLQRKMMDIKKIRQLYSKENYKLAKKRD